MIFQLGCRHPRSRCLGVTFSVLVHFILSVEDLLAGALKAISPSRVHNVHMRAQRRSVSVHFAAHRTRPRLVKCQFLLAGQVLCSRSTWNAHETRFKYHNLKTIKILHSQESFLPTL